MLVLSLMAASAARSAISGAVQTVLVSLNFFACVGRLRGSKKTSESEVMEVTLGD